MSWKIPLSTNTTIDLIAYDNLYVAEDVDVFVENDDAIQAHNNSQVIIAGSVISDSYSAINVGTSGTVSNDLTLTITATGRVRALDADGISVDGPGCIVNNHGQVIASGWAFASSADDSGTMKINNTGRMSGYVGIYAGTNETVILKNSGTITGTDGSYEAGDAGLNRNLITNTGRMNGEIILGFGNDLYDGRKGHLNGNLRDLGGNDRIYGGTENNTFNGGVGRDQLWGGGGADTLIGGADADRFIFKALSDSTTSTRGRDAIVDFTHSVDRIDLGSIDANSRAKGDQAFHFIGAQDFHDRAGELHFVRTSAGDTMIQGDVNGDGKADFAIRLVGHISLNSGDFML
jgi:Ca2+-binding RTX toxin-like protein